jgi:hypothetical protein
MLPQTLAIAKFYAHFAGHLEGEHAFFVTFCHISQVIPISLAIDQNFTGLPQGIF